MAVTTRTAQRDHAQAGRQAQAHVHLTLCTWSCSFVWQGAATGARSGSASMATIGNASVSMHACKQVGEHMLKLLCHGVAGAGAAGSDRILGAMRAGRVTSAAAAAARGGVLSGTAPRACTVRGCRRCHGSRVRRHGSRLRTQLAGRRHERCISVPLYRRGPALTRRALPCRARCWRTLAYRRPCLGTSLSSGAGRSCARCTRS